MIKNNVEKDRWYYDNSFGAAEFYFKMIENLLLTLI